MGSLKNFLVYFVVPAAIILGLFYLVQSSKEFQGGGGPASEITPVAEKSFNFGSVSMAEGIVRHTFKIKNNGNEEILVKKIYTSCMCTNVTLQTKTEKLGPFGMPGHGFSPSIDLIFAPGEEAQIEASFDPAAHGPAGIGRIERAIFVESKDHAPLELTISALVKP